MISYNKEKLDRVIQKSKGFNPEKIALYTTKEIAVGIEKEIQSITEYGGTRILLRSLELNGTKLTADLDAVLKGIAFLEYGTGMAGMRSPYPGKLPKDTLVFQAWGDIQTTRGWEYSYEPKGGYTDSKQPNYWKYKGQKYTGNPAYGGLYQILDNYYNARIEHIALKVHIALKNGAYDD